MIIGHTRGLGRCLEHYFKNKGYLVEGFSRSNGHDISSSEVRANLIERSLAFDFVIICARAGFAQSELLFELHRFWREKKHHRHIVTIGSKAAVNYLSRAERPMLYDYTKISLQKLAETLSLYTPIQVSHFNLDYLNTESIRSNSKFENEPKLDLEFVAQQVELVLNLPENVTMTRVDLWAR